MEHPGRQILEIEFLFVFVFKGKKEEKKRNCSGYCTCFPSLTDRRPRSRTGEKEKKERGKKKKKKKKKRKKGHARRWEMPPKQSTTHVSKKGRVPTGKQEKLFKGEKKLTDTGTRSTTWSWFGFFCLFLSSYSPSSFCCSASSLQCHLKLFDTAA